MLEAPLKFPNAGNVIHCIAGLYDRGDDLLPLLRDRPLKLIMFREAKEEEPSRVGILAFRAFPDMYTLPCLEDGYLNAWCPQYKQSGTLLQPLFTFHDVMRETVGPN